MEKYLEALSSMFKTNPEMVLGGFALFLVFLILTKTNFCTGRPRLVTSFFAMAFIALIGGLLLAYFDIQKPKIVEIQSVKPVAEPAHPTEEPSITMNQATTGGKSPIINDVNTDKKSNSSGNQATTGYGSAIMNNVKGDVTYTFDKDGRQTISIKKNREEKK